MADGVQVIEGAGPPDPVLFLDGAFNAFQAQAQGKRLVTFQLQDGDGAVSLTLGGADGRWSSPVTGAFGGLAVRGTPPARAVFAVVETATAWLRGETGARSATLRLPPDVFATPWSAALENALFRTAWRLEQVDLNHHLPVVEPDTHFATLGETRRKELRRLQRSGAVVAETDRSSARAVYDVIAANRAATGYPMTMTWPQVETLADGFPDRVQVFDVTRDGAMLAGAICLRVSPAHTYVFYWGEQPEVRRESPVVLLASGLLAHAMRAGVSILDIGISTDRSSPNPGLIAFKESLGCVASARRTYALELS